MPDDIRQSLGDLADSGAARHLANPLGVGGRGMSQRLADPLGLFNRGGRRMSPTKRARRDEEARQQRMQGATDRVNAVFDAPQRAADLQDFVDALRARYRMDADQQRGVQDRRLRFSMARSGLTGGSAAVDANRTLGEEYTRGLLDAENRAQEAQGNLRAEDERSRMDILSMIRQGLDSTTAASRAGAAMQANAQSASGRALSEGLGDMFGTTAATYKQQQEAAERRRGERVGYGSVWGAGR